MRKSFKLDLKAHARQPKHLVRLGLGILLAANLVAAWFVFRTPGGSVEELEREMVTRRQQLATRQQSLERVRKTAATVAKAREAGDQFLGDFFLPRRNAYSMLEVDLSEAAKSAGIKAKERTYNYEPIEGSDTLGMLNINANFEGTYADLIEFVNHVDRSKKLLIIEQLQAQPQQGASTLAVNVRLNAFFRLEGPDAPPLPEIPSESAATAQTASAQPPSSAPSPAPVASAPPPSQPASSVQPPVLPVKPPRVPNARRAKREEAVEQ